MSSIPLPTAFCWAVAVRAHQARRIFWRSLTMSRDGKWPPASSAASHLLFSPVSSLLYCLIHTPHSTLFPSTVLFIRYVSPSSPSCLYLFNCNALAGTCLVLTFCCTLFLRRQSTSRLPYCFTTQLQQGAVQFCIASVVLVVHSGVTRCVATGR